MTAGRGVTCGLLGQAWVVEFSHGVGLLAGATVDKFPRVADETGVAATGTPEDEMSVEVWLFGETTLVTIGKGTAGVADTVPGRVPTVVLDSTTVDVARILGIAGLVKVVLDPMAADVERTLGAAALVAVALDPMMADVERTVGAAALVTVVLD